MISKKTVASVLFAGLLFSSVTYAQINLNSFWSSSARTGYTVPTHVDSLLVDTKVNNGLAVTRVTMTITPGGYLPYYSASSAMEMSLDSIEITLSFTLPTDFVADSMWLWIGGRPQEAYIQDRELADAQYRQIVGRRRDPAILQYNGAGGYFLRIFPATSNVARKIAIQFHHTFDDDSVNAGGGNPLITASLPVVYDTAQRYYYYSYNYTKKAIRFVRLSCQALDSKSYSATIPGLGSGTFSRTSALLISGNNTWNLQKGIIVADDPSGTANEYLWAGRDLKSTKLAAGFSTKLAEADLTFLPEPATRIIVVDAKDSIWNWNDYYRLQASASGRTYYSSYYSYAPVDIWGRAQKYALLALESYVKCGQSFNVIFAGSTSRSVFSSPVRATDANKRTAIAAILSAVPDPAANTLAALQSAAAQADSGIVVLISDLYMPYNYYAAGTTYPLPVSAQGIAYDSTLARIDALFKRMPSLTLFTISDNWKLNQTSSLSGGYPIGGLRNSFTIPYSYVVINGQRMMNLYLFPLFGSSNPNRFSRMNVRSSDLDDIVFTIEGCGIYQPVTGPFITPVPVINFARMEVETLASPPSANSLAKTLIVPVPAASQASSLLRVAGRTSNAAFRNAVRFTVEGKLGGLRFTRAITADADYDKCGTASMRLADDVQWAFRKTEWLAADNWMANAGAIKQIGKEYHIVTRQTSLLALEPGMTLWPDTIGQSSSSTASAVTVNSSSAAVRVAFDMTTETIGGAPASGLSSGSGITIDSISKESLSDQDGKPVIKDRPSVRIIAAGVAVAGSNIMLQLPPLLSGTITVALYDLNGRRLASQTIDASRYTGGRFVWDLSKGNVSRAQGQYMLRITGGGYDKIFRIPMLGW